MVAYGMVSLLLTYFYCCSCYEVLRHLESENNLEDFVGSMSIFGKDHHSYQHVADSTIIASKMADKSSFLAFLLNRGLNQNSANLKF